MPRATRPKNKRAPDRSAPPLLILALLVAAACGGAGARAPSASSRPVGAPASITDAGTGADAALEPLPTVDEIAATGATSAPGMREALRVVEGVVPLERPFARATDRDMCARAAFVASGQVDVALVEGPKTLLEQHAVKNGVVGTACVARGGTLGLRFALPDGGADAASARVNAVGWVSP
jgi:hypothetical protein